VLWPGAVTGGAGVRAGGILAERRQNRDSGQRPKRARGTSHGQRQPAHPRRPRRRGTRLHPRFRVQQRRRQAPRGPDSNRGRAGRLGAGHSHGISQGGTRRFLRIPRSFLSFLLGQPGRDHAGHRAAGAAQQFRQRRHRGSEGQCGCHQCAWQADLPQRARLAASGEPVCGGRGYRQRRRRGHSQQQRQRGCFRCHRHRERQEPLCECHYPIRGTAAPS
jgi:hypothetical protein